LGLYVQQFSVVVAIIRGSFKEHHTISAINDHHPLFVLHIIASQTRSFIQYNSNASTSSKYID